MEKFGSLGDLLGAPPCWIDVGILSEPFNQGMCFLAKCARLLSCKLPLHEHITILIVESTLLLCQYHSFLLSFSGISNAPLIASFSISANRHPARAAQTQGEPKPEME